MTHLQIHNRKEFESRRKNLRKNLTAAEAALWSLLKNKKLDGRKFRRQHSVDRYILDFYCPSERLGIELDGEKHFTTDGMLYDERRGEYLESVDIRVLRFENEEVFQSPEGVLAEIRKWFRDNE
ncbi:MAG TPA: endonuclease domain-containing protein [Chryseosolibacter sp.]|nr:endonuclease domain-containing protein [Chryseosolibacter sp.]